MNIRAKKTRYKGITFRSRLEACWAVFWEANGYELNPKGSDRFCEFEPFSPLFDDGYTPDFQLASGGFSFYQEVKPVFPNADYRAKLLVQAENLAMNGFPLILSVGGFRDEFCPMIFHYPYWECFGSCAHSLEKLVNLKDINAAIECARNIRWDLCETEQK